MVYHSIFFAKLFCFANDDFLPCFISFSGVWQGGYVVQGFNPLKQVLVEQTSVGAEGQLSITALGLPIGTLQSLSDVLLLM